IMDCDLDAIKKAIGHESDDDIEANEELMAELLALNGDNLQDFEIVKRPRQPPKTAPKPKQQKQELVIPSNILNLENDDVDMEVSEADMNDKDLLVGFIRFNFLLEINVNIQGAANLEHFKLGGLVGSQSSDDVELNEESTSQFNITQNHASCQSLIDIKSEEEEVPSKETESPLKMDTSLIREEPSNPMFEESVQPTKNDNQPSSSLDSIAHAMNEGATLSEEDIQQIPPSPPPYKSALIKPEVKPIKAESSAVKHSDKNAENKAKTVAEPYMSDELKLVTSRQMQLKKAALTAKNQGDMDTAKELLSLAMRMKPMTLERELLKQISLCTEKSSQFQSVGDSKNTLFYEALLQTCKNNLQSVQMAMLGNAEFPRPGVDLICKVKYTNKLPDLPFEPKFLQSPFVSLNRFVNYKPSTLEKNFKYELLTEPDLNVKIDLISTTYQLDGIDKPHLHPIDEQLLEDESIQQLNTKRSIQHRKVVPWMRKTEYISTEFNRYGLGQTGVDRPDTKIGYGMKNRLKDETIDYKDRSSQIAAIERTFEHAKKPIKRHYSRPGVTAVEEIPILPDFDLWKFPFAQVLFDADPLPYCKNHRQEKLTLSILRGMADSEGNQFVGYFSPFDEALEQRLADDKKEIGSYKEDFEYQHKLEREYNWSVQNKATKGYEQENYFMVLRGSTFYYNELETRVKLARRVKGSNTSTSNNTILSVTNRMLDSKELSQMQVVQQPEVEEAEEVGATTESSEEESSTSSDSSDKDEE
uniref:RNA polymerase II-associated factor 1 homolog n=1 Tax=Meloidogyne javanica TaxID=6303 RepID=A0A915M165_MELJA